MTLLCAGLSLVPSPVLAMQGVVLGMKAGAVLSNLRGQGSSEWASTTGVTVGAFAGLPVREWFAIQLEVLLTQKGTVRRQVSSTPEFVFERATRIRPLYLEVPIMGRVSVPVSGSATRIGLLLGVQAAFSLTCRETSTPRVLSGTFPSMPPILEYECSRRLTSPESPEVAVLVGTLLDVELGRVPLTFEFRYAPSVFDLAHSPYPAERNFAEHHYVALAVTMGATIFRF
jgi:hypothetical protein